MKLRTKKIIAREFLVTLGCLLVSLLYFTGTFIYNNRLESQRADILKEIEIKTNDLYKISDLKQILRAFVVTNNSGKYKTEDELLLKFPELKDYDKQALRDFVATVNSGKYETEEELFSKFPEFNISVAQQPVIETAISKINAKLNNQKWLYNEGNNRVIHDYKNSEQLWLRLTSLYKTDSVIYKWDNVWNNDLKNFLQEIGFKDGYAFNSFIGKNILNDEEKKSSGKIRILREEINTLNEKSINLKDKRLHTDDQIELSFGILFLAALIGFPLRYFIYAIGWSYNVLKQNE